MIAEINNSCPNCEATISYDVARCPSCGFDLPANNQHQRKGGPTAVQQICASCGASAPSGSKFCSNCGFAFAPARFPVGGSTNSKTSQSKIEPSPGPKRRWLRKIMWAIMTCVFGLASLWLLLIVFQNRQTLKPLGVILLMLPILMTLISLVMLFKRRKNRDVNQNGLGGGKLGVETKTRFSGIARNVQIRSRDGSFTGKAKITLEVLTFRVDRFDQDLPPIPVEMVGKQITGVLNEGNEVEIEADWVSGQTLSPEMIHNLTTSGFIKIVPTPEVPKILYVFFLIPFIIIFAFFFIMFFSMIFGVMFHK